MPKANALIIDDSASNVRVLQQLLTMEDVASFSIPNAKTLEHHLNLLLNIDIVFLDLEMPTIDGYQAVHIIKTHPNFQQTKVVAYSVHVSEIYNVRQKGFDGFLGKPIDAELFPEHLSRILQGEEVFYTP